MGLDTVELVMEIEEEFDIKIDDRDAEKIITVGGLYQYLLDKLSIDTSSLDNQVCLTATTFYSIRRAIQGTTETSRDCLRVNTKLSTLIDREQKNACSELQEAIRNEIPGERPSVPLLFVPRWRRSVFWVLTLAVWLAIGCAVVGVVYALAVRNSVAAGVAFVGLFLTIWIFGELIRYKRTVLNPAGSTLGELAKTLLARNYATIAKSKGTWNTRAEIWDRMAGIISEQLAVPRDIVQPSARFVKDLGCD